MTKIAVTTVGAVAEEVVVIAVMGMTGSGKSNFIKIATGSDEDIVGEDLTSCTEKPRLHEFQFEGRTVVLIDTPGFDDTFRTDADVLQEIASCLAMTYVNNMLLTGIIYLHRIIDPRITHGGVRNLDMFRKLCGKDPMKNVVLATTFWEEVNPAKGEHREQQLKTTPEWWGEMIEQGADMTRFYNTKEAALAMISKLAKQKRTSLDIQIQMCQHGLKVGETSAGEALSRELAELEQRHEQKLREIQENLEGAIRDKDEQMQSTLRTQAEKHEQDLRKMRAQQEVMKEDRRNEIRECVQDFERRLRQAEAERKLEAEAALNAQKKAYEDQMDHVKQQHREAVAAAEAAKKREIDASRNKILGALGLASLAAGTMIIEPAFAPVAIDIFIAAVNSVFAQPDVMTATQTSTSETAYTVEEFEDN